LRFVQSGGSACIGSCRISATLLNAGQNQVDQAAEHEFLSNAGNQL